MGRQLDRNVCYHRGHLFLSPPIVVQVVKQLQKEEKRTRCRTDFPSRWGTRGLLQEIQTMHCSRTNSDDVPITARVPYPATATSLCIVIIHMHVTSGGLLFYRYTNWQAYICSMLCCRIWSLLRRHQGVTVRLQALLIASQVKKTTKRLTWVQDQPRPYSSARRICKAVCWKLPQVDSEIGSSTKPTAYGGTSWRGPYY